MDPNAAVAAVQRFYRRADRSNSGERPAGRTRGRYWHPSGKERRECCDRWRRRPAAYYGHCRSFEHICMLHSADLRMAHIARRMLDALIPAEMVLITLPAIYARERLTGHEVSGIEAIRMARTIMERINKEEA